MPDITLSETVFPAVNGFDKTKEMVSTTQTRVVEPIFSSIERVSGPPDEPQNFNIDQLDSPGSGIKVAERGFLRGRRPQFGLLFPRGYYNR